MGAREIVEPFGEDGSAAGIGGENGGGAAGDVRWSVEEDKSAGAVIELELIGAEEEEIGIVGKKNEHGDHGCGAEQSEEENGFAAGG